MPLFLPGTNNIMKTLFLSDAMAAAFTKKERTFYFLLLFFFFALYMPGVDWLYNVGMWLIFVGSFFYNTPREKWEILKKRKAVLLLIVFFLLNFASGLLSHNSKEGISWIGIRISFLVFPVAIGSVFISQLLKERILLAFVVATCCAATLCIVHASILAAYQHDLSLLYNDNLSYIINLQSIYFAMLVNMALFSFAYLYAIKSTLVYKYSWLPVLLILLPVHFLLASRIAIIILYSLIFLFAVYTAVYRKKIWQGLALATGLVTAALLLLLIFPKTLNRFKELGYTKYNYSSRGRESHFNMAITTDQWNGANLRLAVWSCAWAVTKDHMLFGTGLGDKMEVLKKQYAAKGFAFGEYTNRNVHNSYLDVWMSLGLIGLILFLAGILILPALTCIKTGDWYGLLVITALCVSIISETYIDRTVGNTILSFFLSFIACYKKPGELPGLY